MTPTPSDPKHVRYQLLLGDDSFIASHKTAQEPESLRDVSKAQRRAVSLTLEEYKRRYEKYTKRWRRHIVQEHTL